MALPNKGVKGQVATTEPSLRIYKQGEVVPAGMRKGAYSEEVAKIVVKKHIVKGDRVRKGDLEALVAFGMDKPAAKVNLWSFLKKESCGWKKTKEQGVFEYLG